MKSTNAATSTSKREEQALDGRYGKIGIPAVAAAVRYQSDAKNPAYAPVVPRSDERFAESGAVA
jgi:hypothetical protein